MIVAMNAYYHANPDESFPLDVGHTVPLGESERDFRTEHGLEALEQRFDDARLHYWDARRSAVV